MDDDVTAESDGAVTPGKDATTYSGVTSKPSKPSVSTSLHCCRCVKNVPFFVPPEEREEAMSEARAAIKAKLQTDRHSLSSYIRSKQSAPDPRLASAIVGSTVGIACFVIVFGFVVGSDVVDLIRFLMNQRHRENHVSS
ncbi:hypothetical protein ACOMHN_062678 [Nucella lapillus]